MFPTASPPPTSAPKTQSLHPIWVPHLCCDYHNLEHLQQQLPGKPTSCMPLLHGVHEEEPVKFTKIIYLITYSLTSFLSLLHIHVLLHSPIDSLSLINLLVPLITCQLTRLTLFLLYLHFTPSTSSSILYSLLIFPSPYISCHSV